MPSTVTETTLNEPVVRHLRTEVARLRVGDTVGEALAALRQSPPPARIVYFYVVDGENRLQGVIPARSLLLSPPEARIADLMFRGVVAIPHDATVLDACEFFVLHRLLAFPVVDDRRRLIGAIDVELYTDELQELQESGGGAGDDLFQLVGVHLARAKYRNPVGAFRVRFPWLICNILGGIAAALLCGAFESQINRTVVLAMFIPVVLGLSESVSIQSVSLALQMLHGEPPTWRQIFQKLRRELTVGALLGIAGGSVVALVALGWIGKWREAVCVWNGIAAGVMVSAALGVAAPTLFRRLKIDPQVAAGPLALAASDLVTLFCYFIVARWLLG